MADNRNRDDKTPNQQQQGQRGGGSQQQGGQGGARQQDQATPRDNDRQGRMDKDKGNDDRQQR